MAGHGSLVAGSNLESPCDPWLATGDLTISPTNAAVATTTTTQRIALTVNDRVKA